MFTRILVPLDGSSFAETALPPALEVAAHFNSHVTLLRVMQAADLGMVIHGATYDQLLIHIQDKLYEECRRYLEIKQESLRRQGYQVDSLVGEGAPAAETILQTIDKLGIDLVVMSTHGRGGLSRWVFGSVADKVLRQARAPVLLIRASSVRRDDANMLQ